MDNDGRGINDIIYVRTRCNQLYDRNNPFSHGKRIQAPDGRDKKGNEEKARGGVNMGCRTWIYNSDDNECLCLGKLVAYVRPYEGTLPNLKKWCDDNITDKDDRIYLFGGRDEDGDYWEGYFNIGYCYEAITFNESFNRDQIADFVTAFIRDNANGPYPRFDQSFYQKIGNLLANDTKFTIQWTEGG